MDRRTRICIWIIFAGLGNFLAYVILYWFFWGEAVNGWVAESAEGLRYYLQSGEEVSRGVFLYSGIHSISIAPTVGAVMLAMLTLAKDRVVASMRRTILRGRTVITILATIITLIVLVWTVWFILQFGDRLTSPRPAGTTGPASRSVSGVRNERERDAMDYRITGFGEEAGSPYLNPWNPTIHGIPLSPPSFPPRSFPRGRCL